MEQLTPYSTISGQWPGLSTGTSCPGRASAQRTVRHLASGSAQDQGVGGCNREDRRNDVGEGSPENCWFVGPPQASWRIILYNITGLFCIWVHFLVYLSYYLKPSWGRTLVSTGRGEKKRGAEGMSMVPSSDCPLGQMASWVPTSPTVRVSCSVSSELAQGGALPFLPLFG